MCIDKSLKNILVNIMYTIFYIIKCINKKSKRAWKVLGEF